MRTIVLTLHRYLGAALCALFAVWFASGLVMVFARFPALDEDQRLAALPALAPAGEVTPLASLPSPAQLFAQGAGLTPRDDARIRLGLLGGRAVYRVIDGGEGRDARAALVDARDAALPVNVDATTLAGLVADRLGDAPVDARAWTVSPIERRDQWTMVAPATAQLPLRRFDVGDAAATQIYVSLPTAEVVQITNRHQRLWAWLGAIPHWIYPAILRRHVQIWRQVVLWLAAAGALLCLSGLTLGIWHWRGWPRRRNEGRRRSRPSPYRERWIRWHQYLGLGFGCLAFTWVGSGALSLNPFHWSGGGSEPSAEESLAVSGGPIEISRFVVPPAVALAACGRQLRARELELRQIGGRPYYLCRAPGPQSRLVAADRPGNVAAVRALSLETALAAGRALWPEDRIADVSLLRAGDGYAKVDAEGTILRVRTRRTVDEKTNRARANPAASASASAHADHGAVWYYLDLRAGTLAARYGAAARGERWLYHGFHSLDLPFAAAVPLLRPHSPLWYAAIVALCGLGLFFSLTGIVVALGWLARARRRRKREA